MMTKTAHIALTVTLGVIMACVGTIVVAQTSPAFEPVPESKIDQAQKDKASQIANTTLGNWLKGQFGPLSDDFTSQMKEKLTPEAQKLAIADIKAKLGDLQSAELAEAVVSPGMPGIVVYRFKGRFSKETGEVRVVLDKQGRVAGLWVKPWQDKMQ